MPNLLIRRALGEFEDASASIRLCQIEEDLPVKAAERDGFFPSGWRVELLSLRSARSELPCTCLLIRGEDVFNFNHQRELRVLDFSLASTASSAAIARTCSTCVALSKVASFSVAAESCLWRFVNRCWAFCAFDWMVLRGTSLSASAF